MVLLLVMVDERTLVPCVRTLGVAQRIRNVMAGLRLSVPPVSHSLLTHSARRALSLLAMFTPAYHLDPSPAARCKRVRVWLPWVRARRPRTPPPPPLPVLPTYRPPLPAS